MSVNQARWDELVPHHARSAFYDVEGFKAGRNTVDSVSLDLLGDVQGKSLLHLQCHFGMDTLSLARLGADVTGVDFSEPAIELARSLADEIGVRARFIQTNLYDLPDVLDEPFDLVFTSHGTIVWLPDIRGWAEIVARYLKPGGRFVFVDGHPFTWMLNQEVDHLEFEFGYFNQQQAFIFDEGGSYADMEATLEHTRSHEWHHGLGDIVNAQIDAGLRIERVDEHPFVAWKMLKMMVEVEGGWWRLPDEYPQLPFTLTIRATK